MNIGKLTYSESLIDYIISIEEEYISSAELCIKSDCKEIEKCLNSGCSFGLFDGDKLVGFSLCYYSDYCTGYIEKTFILPAYRGCGYQKELTKTNLTALKCLGVDEVYSMVSPNNIASKKSLTSVGFRKKKDVVYNGLQRVILKLNQ